MSLPEQKAKFGWCLTNNHEGCSKENNGLKCGCSCHSKKKETKKRSVKRK